MNQATVHGDHEMVKKALELLGESSKRIADQAIKVKDVEIAAQLDMLKMSHWKCQKKLKEYLNKITEEKVI